MAASTVMPTAKKQQVWDSDTTKWLEGHCMILQKHEAGTTCTLCDETCDESFFQCKSCPLKSHAGCTDDIVLPCPAAFRPGLVRAAFVRCFASLFYTYRRFLQPATGERQRSGLHYSFAMDAFIKSVPGENTEFLRKLQQTQAFNQFIHERESASPEDPAVKLFDEVVLAKRNRGKKSMFSKSGESKLVPW